MAIQTIRLRTFLLSSLLVESREDTKIMAICRRNYRIVRQSYFQKRGGRIESLIYRIFLAQQLTFSVEEWLQGGIMTLLNASIQGFLIILLICLPLSPLSIEEASPTTFNCLIDYQQSLKSVFIILLMYRRERQFNIISGETQPYASQNYRTSSNVEKIRRFQQAQHTPITKAERLGNSKDRRQFQYSYQSFPNAVKTENYLSQRKSLNYNPTMLNSVSTDYNIVNLRGQHPTSKIVNSHTYSQKLPEVNKKSPLTAHIQAGRLFALNYHPEYPQRMANKQFHRKKNLCDNICENQKTYGMTYFRVLK